MQRQQPVTKIHKLMELIHARKRKQNGARLSEGVEYFVELVESKQAALISVSPDVRDLMQREDVQSSYKAVVEAGINRLPYPKMVIEFDSFVNPRIHYVVTLEEHNIPGSKVLIKACAHFMDSATGVVDMSDGYVLALTSPNLIEIYSQALLNDSWEPDIVEIYKGCVAFSIYVALVMLNTKGIHKTVIETSKLNKKRLRQNEAPIPTHTRISLGVVYRRDGKGEYFGGHKKMPVHLRSAHTRMQPCGPNNEDRKLVFIPACIVNYEPGVEPNQPMKHLVP